MKRKQLIMICCIVSIILLCGIGLNILKKHQNKSKTIERTTLVSEREEVIENATEETIDDTMINESKEENLSIPEEIIQPQPEIQEPIMTDPVIPKDVHVLKEEDGKIKSYYENVEEYIWEYYDESEKSWKFVSENENIHLTGEMDELNRSISVLKIKGIDINNELLVRCKIKLPDHEEEIIHQATFNLLDFSKEDINNLVVSADFKSEAGTYVDVLDIPIKIIKKDDSEMEVTGLNDLFFYMPKEVSSDTEKNLDGTTVETVTTTSIEKEYHQITAGENKIMLRYRGTVPGIDVNTTLIGTDSLPPEVTVQLSDYNISNTKAEDTDIKATIHAEDNYSPITKLLYGFKNKEDPIKDEDFRKNNIFDLKVSQNGIWTAYVKDEIGNIATEDIEIIVVDQKAPVIESVTLKNQEEGWQKENIICVIAKDKTNMKYSYVCEANNIDSGWIDESEYEITQNGSWKVKVKDAAGNENDKEVSITNVDNQPPIILSVEPKKLNEANDMAQIGTLEERVDVTIKGANVKETSSDYDDINNSYDSSSFRPGGSLSKTDSISSSYYPSNNTTASTVKGEKGERGATGAAGTTGTAGVAGKDGASSYLHIKYSESPTGNNMSGSPVDSSKYIGIYTGNSSVAPSSASSYQWSLYKGSSSHIYIRYADSADGANMTEFPKDENSFIGICSSTESLDPDNPQSYTWSKYRDDKAITELQNKIEELQKQIDELKTPTP